MLLAGQHQMGCQLSLKVKALDARLPPLHVWLPQARKLVHPLEARPGVALPRTSRESTKGLNSAGTILQTRPRTTRGLCPRRHPSNAPACQSMQVPCNAVAEALGLRDWTQ